MSNEPYKGFRHGVRTSTCAQPLSLGDYIAAELAMTPSALTALELIELGAVYVNDERSLNPARSLKTGDEIRTHSDPRRYAEPLDLTGRILAEDTDSLLAEKPSGLPVEATVDNFKENFVAFLENLRGQNLFLTHRLETESEGPLLIAKSTDAAARISRAFAEGRIKRTYAAYTTAPILPDDLGNSIQAKSCDERKAPTSLISEAYSMWQLSSPLPLHYRIEIEFTTARPKEVRERLAALGAPIIGDRQNGSTVELRDALTQKATLAFRATALALI